MAGTGSAGAWPLPTATTMSPQLRRDFPERCGFAALAQRTESPDNSVSGSNSGHQAGKVL